ncbi:MAG: PqqD family protein of HPr-rel-A system [Halioglobus sp.]|jgi:PqqD family protein of HPr-rel-A system
MLWHIESIGRFYDPNEGMVVYFDRATGDTHLLSGFAAFVIEQCAGQALTTDALIEKLSGQIEDMDAAALQDSVTNVLDELFSLDILQQV